MLIEIILYVKEGVINNREGKDIDFPVIAASTIINHNQPLSS